MFVKGEGLLNNNILNAADENWFIKKNPSYKPTFPLAPAKEPVAVNLPLLKTETPKITNYSDKGGKKKNSGTKLLGKDFFNITLSPELTKAINEYMSKQNPNFSQESFDKSSNMWYHKPKNNSSGMGVGSLITNAPAAGLQNLGKAKKASENSSPQKEVGGETSETRNVGASEKQLKKERNDFFADVDFNNLPTEEQMSFADGAFANQPGFLENNNILRNISRYVRNNASDNNITDAESKRQAARRAYEEKYRAELAETKEDTKENILYSDILFPSLKNLTAEFDQYVKEYAEALHEEERYIASLSGADKAEYYFKKYLSEEERKDIENGESLMTYVVNLDGDEQEKLLTAMQEAYNELPKDKQEEYAFFAEGALRGLARDDKKRIFEKLKSVGYLKAEHLVELGLFTEKNKNSAIATEFLGAINGSYKAKQFGTSFEELEFRLNQERIGQAYSVVADNLFKISDAAVNGPSRRYSSSDGDILYSDNVNVKPKKYDISYDAEEALPPLENGPYIKNGKPNGRPAHKGKMKLWFEETIYRNQVDADGVLRDPNTGAVIPWKPGQPRKGVADFGHKPGKDFKTSFKKYVRREISFDEFKEFNLNPDNYQIETPSTNRSRRYQ